METRNLRSRRRDRNVSNPNPSHSLTKRAPNRVSAISLIPYLTIFAQLLLILYLFFNPRSTSSPTISTVQHHSPPLPPNAPVTSANLHVTIYAYDRPRQLLDLLLDLDREANVASLNISVTVIDDNSYACVFSPIDANIFSTEDAHDPTSVLVRVPLDAPHALPCTARYRFRDVEQVLQQHGWSMYVTRYRHARRRYWHLVAAAHGLLKNVQTKYYLFLPDDDRLSKGFFKSIIARWEGIRDSRKMTMLLHVEETREKVPVWTTFKPRDHNEQVMRVGFVESGNFICEREFLAFMNWSFPVVPVQRWINNPNISSGVGSTISELLHASGKRMFRTKESFVAHIGVTLSKMNAQFRDKHKKALLTKYFSDGEEVYEMLLEEASTVTASMASQWTRATALHSAVQSLAHQVDHLNVYLNGYDSVPAFLNAPYITAIRSQEQGEKGDIGDVGKFFWSNDIETEFHFTVDDDIIYPPDYVTEMLKFWRRFQAPIIVGVHGIRIKQQSLTPTGGRKSRGYYGSREVWMAIEKVRKPVNVHIIGTGTMLYRPIDIGRLDITNTFQYPNMADIWFGLLTQRLKIPMMVIPHDEGWIQEVPGTMDDSIYMRSTRKRRADRLQTQAAQSIETWNLHSALRRVT